MNWNNIFTVYRKELRDMLRDRRTILSMLVVPMLLMPGLMAGVGFVSYRIVKKAEATAPTVMVLGGADSPKARAALASDTKIKIVALSADWKQRISDKKVQAAVEIPPDFDGALERGEPATVKIYNYAGEMRSGMAAGELGKFFSEYREKLVAARLTARGLPPTFVRPFDVRTENVAAPEKVGGNIIGGIIPYLMLVLAFSGAMYPAMDLTAGEKERGTMETVLCSPVARIDLVLGKFLMVLTASLATVLCSLTSMIVTVAIAGSALSDRAGAAAAGRGAKAFGAIPTVDPVGMIAVVGMVLPMAVLFSAALLTISLFAKSYKEAQSYVSPLVIVILLPAIVGILPGVDLNARLALVPILNVSLASKELVSGIWHWHYLALIFGSSCVYAVLGLLLAVKMFNREDVLFRA